MGRKMRPSTDVTSIALRKEELAAGPWAIQDE
jgi:hypothetical protein